MTKVRYLTIYADPVDSTLRLTRGKTESEIHPTQAFPIPDPQYAEDGAGGIEAESLGEWLASEHGEDYVLRRLREFAKTQQSSYTVPAASSEVEWTF